MIVVLFAWFLFFFLLEGVSILSIKHLIMQKLLKVAADLKKLAVAVGGVVVVAGKPQIITNHWQKGDQEPI